jgi:ABC-type branched-subunit amino acid transport system substrate-binding protein
MVNTNTTRRRFLRAGAAATALSLAGCSGGGGGDGDATEPPSDGTDAPGTTAGDGADGTATDGAGETEDGGGVPTEPPSASFAIEQRALAGVAITHDGGDTLAVADLTVEVGDAVAYAGGAFRNGFDEGAIVADGWGEEVTAGDQLVVSPPDGLPTGAAVRVTWSVADESSELAAAPLSAPAYDLGAVLPVEFRVVGREIQAGLEFAVDGLGESAASPYAVETRDSQLDPAEATRQAEAIAESGGDALIGPVTSPGLTRMTDRVLGPQKLVASSPGGATADLSAVDGAEYAFRAVPTAASQGRALARRLERDDGTPAVAVVTGSAGAARPFLEALTGAYGGEVVTVERIARDDDHAAAVERALGADPDALVVEPVGLGFGRTEAALFQDPGVGSLPVRGADLLQTGAQRFDVPSGADLAGVSPDPVGTEIDALTERFRSAGIDDPGQFAYTTFDATAVAALAVAYADATGLSVPDAMRAVGGPDGETVTPTALGDGVDRALRGQPIDYQGVSRGLAFDENGDLATPTLATWTYENASVTVDGEVETA